MIAALLLASIIAGEPVHPIPGAADYCRRYPEIEACAPPAPRAELGDDARDALVRVHTRVMAQVRYVEDSQKYGVPDRWEDALEHGAEGDCEDFAISEMRLLREAGLARGALDMAVAFDRQHLAHIVLVAHMAGRDLVLDSQGDGRVVEPEERPYRYVGITAGGSVIDWHRVGEK